MAGCGGNEPAPVVAPPAPPPAPPPFQPQAVEVALGDNGGAITLMTTEAGGYTLSGEAFAGGAENPVAGEGGRMYVLTLADGSWSAAFQPMAVEVMLGASGETVTLMTTEAGGYVMGEDAFVSGGTAMSSGGGTYALTLAEDGSWTAAFQPMAVEVPLGASGETVTLTSTEAGGYALPDGTVVTAETTYTTASGRTYGVALGADGRPMPVYVPEAVLAALGELGGMLTLYRQEDGSFLNAEGLPVQAGMEVMAAGNTYTLSMADGVWTGTYKPVERTAALGASGGSATLVRAEDGSWWLGDLAVASGSTTEAMNEAGDTNTYTLTLGADGRWSAAYTPAALEIAGTGLEVTRDEDGGGYSVVGMAAVTLPASGAGDITTADGATYRVMKDAEGMLAGLRYALPMKAGVMRANAKGTHAAPTLSADARDTDANEAGTLLKALGADFPVGELLDSGMAEVTGSNIVEGVRADIVKYRDQVAALLALRRDGGIDTAAFDTQVGLKWSAAERALGNIFSAAVDLEETTSESRVVGAFDRLVDALSSLEAFQAATLKDGPDKIAGFQNRNATQARDAFNRSKHSSAATLGRLGSTRFGAAMYNHPTGEKAVNGLGAAERAQAFAWSTMDAVRRASDVQASGSAYYIGETHAVDEKGNLYQGDIDIEVRFTRNLVDGLVSDLARVDTAEPWSHGLGGDVTRITLPTARLQRTGTWVGTASGTNTGRISYLAQAGGLPDATFSGGNFNGRLLGRGADAGEEAYGTWLVEPGGSAQLAGGFGALKDDTVRPDPTQPLREDMVGHATSHVTGTDLHAGELPALKDTLGPDSSTPPRPTGGPIPSGESRPVPTSSASTFNANNNNLVLAATRTGAGATTGPNRTLKLATLFGDGYPLVGEDEDTLWAQQEFRVKTHVAAAKEEIERLQKQLRAVIALDGADANADDTKFANGQRQALYDKIQAQINNHLFGADNGVLTRSETLDDAADWGSTGNPHTDYPVNSAGVAQDSVVLNDVADVLAALDSQEGLTDAFEDGGILAGKLSEGLSAGDFWKKSTEKFLLWTGVTDFTRFGVWRKQYSEHANDNSWTDSLNPGWMSEGTYKEVANREAFAYSPLAQAVYANENARGYPGGVTATYRGETVAVGQTIFYTGEIEARVQWSDSDVAGNVRFRISDLTSTDPSFGALRHGAADYPANAEDNTANADNTGRLTRPRPRTFDVRALIFTAAIKHDAGTNEVGFASADGYEVEVEYDTLNGKIAEKTWTGTRVGAETVTRPGFGTYWDPKDPAHRTINDAAFGPGGTHPGQLNVDVDMTATIGGSFVGQDADGPLGMIGTWSVTGKVFDWGYQNPRLGVGNERVPLYGSFGAEIVPVP